jgi:hypothetical protein
MFLVRQQQDFRQHAAASAAVVFLDGANNEITQTDAAHVNVKLTSPWNVKTIVMGTSDTAVLGQASAIYQTKASSDDVNELNGSIDPNSGLTSGTVWVGTGGSSSTSFTGLRFSNVSIPKNAHIVSAQIQLRPAQNTWIQMGMQIYGEASANSAAFSTTSIPSKRPATVSKVNYSSDANWQTGRWYMLSDISPVIQEIVSRSDWNAGNSLSIILKGTVGTYGRKFVYSIDGNKGYAPRLSVVYETNTPAPTATPKPTNVPTSTATPTPRPTNTPVPPTATPTAIATPTPAPYIDSITLAEDAGFTQNVKQISPVTQNPMTTDYIFSNATPGQKTLYVKFKSTTGQEQVYNANIVILAPSPAVTGTTMNMNGESMSMMAWRVGGKNSPNPLYDKCDDGTDVVAAHNQYYVVAYDGIKYPTWHPSVVVNPITGVGKCYFGHEHGSNPQKYVHWDEIYKHFGTDMNNDGVVSPLVISDDGKITPGDRAGIPFGIANEHMDEYYNKEGRDSIFVRHEDHVGHKIEYVNNEAEMQGNSTHVMAQTPGTIGINVPYYNSANNSNSYLPTGVVCSHLHKFHQGTNSADAVQNNLHEVVFHSTCTSVNVNNINAPAYYPSNTVLLTGMMAFGNPGGYLRFCFNDRTTTVCPLGKNADGSCVVTDPLISKLPSAVNSTSLGRNMVDKYCLDNFATLNPGINYFNPYELWEGDLRIQTPSGKMLAEHGRQWDVLDPVRYVDPSSPTGIGYNQDRCNQGLPYSGNCDRGVKGAAWNSPQAAFKGLHRTAYFGRNRVSNAGGPEIWWTDPLGSNASSTMFTSGLKQRISSVEADIQSVQYRIQQLYGSSNFLNDRALQREFDDGGNTVHAPN